MFFPTFFDNYCFRCIFESYLKCFFKNIFYHAGFHWHLLAIGRHHIKLIFTKLEFCWIKPRKPVSPIGSALECPLRVGV